MARSFGVGRSLLVTLMMGVSLAACGLSLEVPFTSGQLEPDAQPPRADAMTAPLPQVDATPEIDAEPAPVTCGDGIKNGTEVDVDCGGSCASRCAIGATCASTDDCSSDGICDSGVCAIAASCKILHDARPTLTSGTYRVGRARDGGEAQAGCEMSFRGGGWTLALKVDGSKPTFGYDATYWTTDALLNPTATSLDDKTEAKLAAYHDVAVSEVALVFETATARNELVLPATAQSLAELIATRAQSNRGRSAWLAALPTSGLQENCNAEGFSQTRGAVKVRIGIIGNNETTCDNPDSYLGIGGSSVCGRSTVAGNVACFNGNAGDRDLPAFARVLVR